MCLRRWFGAGYEYSNSTDWPIDFLRICLLISVLIMWCVSATSRLRSLYWMRSMLPLITPTSARYGRLHRFTLFRWLTDINSVIHKYFQPKLCVDSAISVLLIVSISAPSSESVILSLTLSVRLFVTNVASSFLFLDRIEPFTDRPEIVRAYQGVFGDGRFSGTVQNVVGRSLLPWQQN